MTGVWFKLEVWEHDINFFFFLYIKAKQIWHTPLWLQTGSSEQQIPKFINHSDGQTVTEPAFQQPNS